MLGPKNSTPNLSCQAPYLPLYLYNFRWDEKFINAMHEQFGTEKTSWNKKGGKNRKICLDLMKLDSYKLLFLHFEGSFFRKKPENDKKGDFWVNHWDSWNSKPPGPP